MIILEHLSSFNKNLLDKKFDTFIVTGMNSKTGEWNIYTTDPSEKSMKELRSWMNDTIEAAIDCLNGD